MPPRSDDFDRNVFINCPFDSEFLPLAQALVFSILRLGLEPRTATERADSGETRIQKIRELIESSCFSVHDLSRMEPLGPHDLPRFNMPFELGLDLGCRYYGSSRCKNKLCLILEREQYRYQRVLSDISGNDIRSHQNDPECLVRVVRNWFFVSRGGPLPSARRLWDDYNLFQVDLKTSLDQLNFSDRDVLALEMAEYIDSVKEWLSRGRRAASRARPRSSTPSKRKLRG